LPGAARAAAANDTPERILAAALKSFSEKGFEGARTRDIAARADVTLGLLQYHFGTKDELWKAAVERAFEDLEAGIERIVADSSGLDERTLLGKMIRAHVRFVAEHTAFIRIMHDEGKGTGPRSRWLTDQYVRPLFNRVTPLFATAQQNGILLRGADPAHFVYALLGATGMIFHQAEECKRVTGIDPATPAAIETHCRVIESLFLGPTEPQQEKTS
jgi:TetR/AcrR family transcriptional regulator